MSRIGKFTVSAALLLPLILGGCKPTKGTANPEDYFPLIQVALAGGETAAMIGRNESIRAKNFDGCVASASLITAFDAGNQILAGRLSDQIVVPAVEVDVSECLSLEEVGSEEVGSAQGHPDAAVLVEAIAGITLTAILHYANKLKAVNCKKGAAAFGAVNYINGMIKPIADEIAEPDGKVSLPSVTIDLSECNDG